MRGNWETVEAMVVTPNHGLQQQEPDGLEENRPHHSSNPPAWGTGDRTIVKNEPIDDKACDSGISLDHYSCSTSSESRRSSTVNGSTSPDSAILNNSNAVQAANYNQFSPEGIYKNEDVPMDFTKSKSANKVSIKRKPRTVEDQIQKMNISGAPKKGSKKPVNDMRCPLAHCSFTTRNRMKFSEHVADHYSNNEMPDLIRGSPRACEYDFGEMEEPGLRVPRVNSQGKIKTYRCKQCNYTSITKLAFWDHNRGHIKCNKLLICSKCPFVTEYKHHLEYHLRNHYGSKPFKCVKCSYTCVNKSMLNSHMKSHSNVYQYRCASCAYATKYLHSLKLHLRKYTHKPAMVLNADGTPNPLPIVDVYGTRRGPKQKNLTPKLGDGSSSSSKSKSSAKAAKQTVAPSQVSPMIHPLNVLASFGNGINPLVALQYNQLYNASFPFGLNGEATENHLEQIRQSLCAEYAKAIANERMMEQSRESSPMVQIPYNNNGATQNDLPTTVASINAQMNALRPMICESGPEDRIIPLDLSKPYTKSNDDIEMKNIQVYHKENLKKQTTATVSQKASGTSRRKGKAFKLNVKQDVENKKEEENRDNFARGQSTSCSTPKQKELKKSADKNAHPEIVSNTEFICQFCEISFGNEVMYTVHMGYHGYRNPYTCNMCGHQSNDKVSFFLHIARSKHN